MLNVKEAHRHNLGIGRSKPRDVMRWAVAHLNEIGMTPADALPAGTSLTNRQLTNTQPVLDRS